MTGVRSEQSGRRVDWRFVARSVAIGISIAVWIAALVWMTPAAKDAHAYFVADPLHPYGPAVGADDAFPYSPAFSQAIEPLRGLGWDAFRTALRATNITALVAFTGPAAGVFAFIDPTMLEIRSANINLLLGLAIVAGFRWPATWAFVLLTKLTPGVGLIWFAVRREWRSLATAFGVTAVIAGVSFAYSPSSWFEWVGWLRDQSEPSYTWSAGFPFVLRLAVGAAIVAWGARTDRRWTVVVGAFLALPTIWANSVAMLLAAAALVWTGRRAKTISSPVANSAAGTIPA